MNDWKLTDAEMDEAELRWEANDSDNPSYGRTMADAATEKALRCAIRFLDGLEATCTLPEDRIAIGRGHGIRMAADALRKML